MGMRKIVNNLAIEIWSPNRVKVISKIFFISIRSLVSILTDCDLTT